MIRIGLGIVLAFLAPAACLPFPAASRSPTEIWVIGAPGANAPSLAAAGFASIADTWIVLDSISFRPSIVSRAGEPKPENRLGVITTMQGGRYHPEVVRAIAEGPEVVAAAAGATTGLLTAEGVEGILLDIQGMTGEDRQALADFTRAFADSARAHSVTQIGVIIPATDSIGYPAAALARSADFLLVKFFPEHGAGTPPGPIVSPSWIARLLGARAGEVGVTRIVAGLPVDGIFWARDSARRVSYSEAMRLAESAGVSFTRDPVSRNLHASSTRDGWNIWMIDQESLAALMAEARRFGVTRFALFGVDGADPSLWKEQR
jgi:spore germination protein YaaH